MNLMRRVGCIWGAIAAVLVYSLLLTTIILKVLDAMMGLRVKDEHEVEGLDVSLHGEKA